MSGVLLPWTAAIGIQTVRDVRVYHRPPVPSEFVASGLVFGALSLLSNPQPQLASWLAWGLLIAIALQAWQQGTKLTERRTYAQVPEWTFAGASSYSSSNIGRHQATLKGISPGPA